MDLARYADSDGFEKDRSRLHAWRYRDWVINAYNRDLPYDQFLEEQLAGDLLPDASIEQKVATGFHRNTLTNTEGGVDQEEYRIEQVIDRTNTTGLVFMGLTVGCAQCHSHKYDPLSQREYYELFSFFNTAVEENIPAALEGEVVAYNRAKAVWEAKHEELRPTADRRPIQGAADADARPVRRREVSRVGKATRLQTSGVEAAGPGKL